jgi:hypothetical protein
MALDTSDLTPTAAVPADGSANRKTWLVSATSFIFILLQSACTAVIEATIGIHGPAHGFHRDAIRIPMMAAATLGSLLNLYVIWRIRSLRSRPSSQWRVRAVTPGQRRSEVFQIVLAALTLALVAAEWITHSMVHRV